MKNRASTDEPDSGDQALDDPACRGQIGAGATELQAHVGQERRAERYERMRPEPGRFQGHLSIRSDRGSEDRREQQTQGERSRVGRNTNAVHLTRLRL